jgi:hypothetical protein
MRAHRGTLGGVSSVVLEIRDGELGNILADVMSGIYHRASGLL